MKNKVEVYKMLAKQFPTPQAVITEIINLQAILNLPKGTEHFLSDLHGETEAFRHILRNASGVIRTKIELVFSTSLTEDEKNELAVLIYYPEWRLKYLKEKKRNIRKEYKRILLRLIEVIKLVSAKYTRSKVRKALPNDYRYILDELINMPEHSIVKSEYYDNILEGILSLGNADKFIVAMCDVISRLAVDHLHIIGDIFDRGNGAIEIMDMLQAHHSVDIQWGNHDILWLGAHFGNRACVCNILRINCAYRNLQGVENYGINLRPLMAFALQEYGNDPAESFRISNVFGQETDFERNDLLAKMTKAITVVQLKIENSLIKAHPEFAMDNRILYPCDELTPKEEALISLLTEEFMQNKRLHEHMRFLLSHGNMYKVSNGNLLLHGCVPTDENGSFSKVPVGNGYFSGKALYDRLDKLVREGARGESYAVDYMWYLWCGKKSPLYGRDKMNVYAKYFGTEAEVENMDPYYTFINEEVYCLKVLEEFGLAWEYSTIVNGHVPVKVKDGERPDSANCRHITIDGGFSKAYHEKTGIGGYTLIQNSQGLFLVSHAKNFSNFRGIDGAVELESESRVLKTYDKRVLVKQTDKGKEILKQIALLKSMLKEYYGL